MTNRHPQKRATRIHVQQIGALLLGEIIPCKKGMITCTVGCSWLSSWSGLLAAERVRGVIVTSVTPIQTRKK